MIKGISFFAILLTAPTALAMDLPGVESPMDFEINLNELPYFSVPESPPRQVIYQDEFDSFTSNQPVPWDGTPSSPPLAEMLRPEGEILSKPIVAKVETSYTSRPLPSAPLDKKESQHSNKSTKKRSRGKEINTYDYDSKRIKIEPDNFSAPKGESPSVTFEGSEALSEQNMQLPDLDLNKFVSGIDPTEADMGVKEIDDLIAQGHGAETMEERMYYLGEAYLHAREINDSWRMAKACLGQGNNYEAIGQNGDALKFYDRVIDLLNDDWMKKQSDKRIIIQANYLLGNIYKFKNEIFRAILLYGNSILLNNYEFPLHAGRSNIAIGDLYRSPEAHKVFAKDKSNEAIKYYSTALKIGVEHEIPELQVMARLGLAKIYARSRNDSAASDELVKVLDLLEHQNGYEALKSEALFRLGKISTLKQVKVQYLREAQQNSADLSPKISMWLGIIGATDEAHLTSDEHFKDALKAAHSLKLRAKILVHRGEYHINNRRMADAEEYLDEAIELLKRNPNTRLQARAFLNRGDICRNNKKYRKAIGWYNLVRDIEASDRIERRIHGCNRILRSR